MQLTFSAGVRQFADSGVCGGGCSRDCRLYDLLSCRLLLSQTTGTRLTALIAKKDLIYDASCVRCYCLLAGTAMLSHFAITCYLQ